MQTLPLSRGGNDIVFWETLGSSATNPGIKETMKIEENLANNEEMMQKFTREINHVIIQTP